MLLGGRLRCQVSGRRLDAGGWRLEAGVLQEVGCARRWRHKLAQHGMSMVDCCAQHDT